MKIKTLKELITLINDFIDLPFSHFQANKNNIELFHELLDNLKFYIRMNSTHYYCVDKIDYLVMDYKHFVKMDSLTLKGGQRAYSQNIINTLLCDIFYEIIKILRNDILDYVKGLYKNEK